ncbi:Poly(rC)-binding protein 3 [Smittium mucronatum]|uniref:Poly(RC)-binding protein 3 n=1 Tax=Smittium mucronatum TaxID=133383 RepID=A0A1R0GSK9_9FUNG|nr:Poly(rC)-binding protein 3 [Smittium mucronatum]
MKDEIRIVGSSSKQRFSLSDYKSNRNTKLKSPEVSNSSNSNSFAVQAKSELENLQFLFNNPESDSVKSSSGTPKTNSKNDMKRLINPERMNMIYNQEDDAYKTASPEEKIDKKRSMIQKSRDPSSHSTDKNREHNSYSINSPMAIDFGDSPTSHDNEENQWDIDIPLDNTWNGEAKSPESDLKPIDKFEDSETFVNSRKDFSEEPNSKRKRNFDNDNDNSYKANSFRDSSSDFGKNPRSEQNSVVKGYISPRKDGTPQQEYNRDTDSRNSSINPSSSKRSNITTSQSGVIITDTDIRSKRNNRRFNPSSPPRFNRDDFEKKRHSQNDENYDTKDRYSSQHPSNDDSYARNHNRPTHYSSDLPPLNVIRSDRGYNLPKKENEISIVSIFSYQDSGVIIGSRGSHLDSLRRTVSDVNWHISSTRIVNQDRLLTVRGRSEDVSRAYFELANHFISQNMYTDIPVPPLRHDMKKNIDTSSPPVALRFIVHNQTCGAVIGHNSDTLHSIRRESRVTKLRVYPGFLSGTRERVIEVIGTPRSIKEAVYQIGLSVLKAHGDSEITYEPIKDGIANFLLDQGAPECSINLITSRFPDRKRNTSGNYEYNSEDDYKFRIKDGDRSYSAKSRTPLDNDGRNERQSNRFDSEPFNQRNTNNISKTPRDRRDQFESNNRERRSFKDQENYDSVDESKNRNGDWEDKGPSSRNERRDIYSNNSRENLRTPGSRNKRDAGDREYKDSGSNKKPRSSKNIDTPHRGR